MDTEKKRRLTRFKRKRKEVRITNLTQHRLNILSSYYQTSETAIIEAAILALGDQYFTDALAEKFHNQTGKNRQFVEKAKKYEKIAENLDRGILYG
jgi:hypothetical protein